MKNFPRKYIFFLFLALPFVGVTQNDTLIIANNYKFKIGVKGLFQKSKLPALTPETKPVYNFGIQGIYKIGKSKSYVESGLYYYTRSFDSQYKDVTSSGYVLYVLNEITYRSLYIPVNYRLDTRIIYFSLGFYVDYLFNIKADNLSKYKEDNFDDRSFIVGYNGSIGLEKSISSQFSFFVETGSSVDITSIHNNNNNQFQFVNYGFAIGVNYKILKQ